MQTGSDFFFSKLLEQQLNFARSMDAKHSGKMKRLVKAWKTKNSLPIYQDMALHKVYEEMWKESIPKSTASDWLSVIPDLLQDETQLEEFLEEKPKKPVQKGEEKYTYDEWMYLKKCEAEVLSKEYQAQMEKLKNPNITDQELMRLTGASQRLIQKINNFGMTEINPIAEEELIKLNDQILARGKAKILASIDSMTAWNFRDLKALSGILHESFQQNRLLEGKSTANIGVGITDIYDKILEKSRQKQLENTVQEGEVEFGEVDVFAEEKKETTQ